MTYPEARRRYGLAKAFRWIASHSLLSFLLPFLMVLIGRGLLLSSFPPPQPLIQDEFSYLLAGQTFASLRLTNPPHPLWQHFETIHELMQPTYMSKYPPMQGLLLAFGQLVFGLPWMGVLLSMAVFCGLLPWAFRAWIPSHWALVGALLATWKIGIMSYWTESYWGGGAAAIGGVLVLGSVKRLSNLPGAGMAAVFTLGCGILANSRPFEGLITVLGYLGYLLWQWLRGGRWRLTWPGYFFRFTTTACIVALPIVFFMGLYNYRVTGKVMELPYQTFERQYSIWTPFVWQKEPSPIPVYHHDFIRREWAEWDSVHKLYERKHWLRVHRENLEAIVHFYFGPTFLAGGCIFVLGLFIGAKNRAIAGLLAFYYAGTSIMSEVLPHYSAPVAALIYLAATAALRAAWFIRPRGIPIGKWITLVSILMFVLIVQVLRTTPENRFLFYKPLWIDCRKQVLSFLDRQPGQQLVFVRHGPLHDVNEIWTFNDPDIDASRIIWVNFMSQRENQQVLDYYGGKRTVWMLDDNAELTLRPYGSPSSEPIIKMRTTLPEPPLDP